MCHRRILRLVLRLFPDPAFPPALSRPDGLDGGPVGALLSGTQQRRGVSAVVRRSPSGWRVRADTLWHVCLPGALQQQQILALVFILQIYISSMNRKALWGNPEEPGVNNNLRFHIQQSQQAEPPVFLCVLTQSPEERHVEYNVKYSSGNLQRCGELPVISLRSWVRVT
ncbi:unnamed protein product [Boreogadus saida]